MIAVDIFDNVWKLIVIDVNVLQVSLFLGQVGHSPLYNARKFEDAVYWPSCCQEPLHECHNIQKNFRRNLLKSWNSRWKNFIGTRRIPAILCFGTGCVSDWLPMTTTTTSTTTLTHPNSIQRNRFHFFCANLFSFFFSFWIPSSVFKRDLKVISRF